MKSALSKKNLWAKTPDKIKSLASCIIEKVPTRFLLGKNFRKQLEFVEKAQWWSIDESLNYQKQALQNLCRTAYERTIYYSKTFREIDFAPGDFNDLEVFQRLPLIDKNTINDNLEKMCVGAIQNLNVDYTTTGGTSGEPLRFYIQSDRSSIEYAYLVSSWKRIGYELGIPMAVFRGRVVQGSKKGFRYEYDSILRQHYYSNFHMNDTEIFKYMRDVCRLGDCYLHVYPSSVYALARYMQKSELLIPSNIKGIIAESENVYPQQRKYVEDTFGCRFFSLYGHTEKLVAGAECEHSTDYHIWPTYGYLELINENGNAVRTPGQIGEIVGTGFINNIVPFIRYRTGDFAVYVNDRCKECGRHHTIIQDIRGHRVQELLVTKTESKISWTALNCHDDTFDNVARFQFYQDRPGYSILKIVPKDNFSEADALKIKRNIGVKVDEQIAFDIQVVEKIPLTKSGKFIYVDQQLHLNNSHSSGK